MGNIVKGTTDFLKNMVSATREITPSLHPEGYFFVAAAFAIALATILVVCWLGVAFFVIAFWVLYFFRDPRRVTPLGDELVISPADGKVLKIESVELPAELELEDKEKRVRISIFLSVFDVHVNRVPISGKVTHLHYHPGKFLSANLDKASDENERQSAIVQTESGKEVIFVQLAGQVARRIVCDLEEKQEVKAGQRYGIIRFGSRVDVYLPKGVNALVAEGQYMLGGETILADLKGKHAARKGEMR